MWCWGHGIYRGIEERAYGNSRDQLKKEVEFPGVFMKNSCGISMGPDVWSWNFQGVKACFLQNF